ncbi:hypothetical protein [Alteromonas gilva]|uniref:Uncharacterized protein n=1 Tax=Alteromonas gilva TaxID=2987522 RepID=A0ABT5L944_9ALTE|nr:hypothetical protein [Alteromonas gilva]MDC8832552.1 hypothetical protein [Alteromonas gilva]
MSIATSLHAQATTAPTMQPKMSTCPGQFHDVVVHEAAKQCQHFDIELPASLVYFVSTSPAALVSYYLTQMPELSRQDTPNERVLLLNPKQNVRIVVSPDDNGAQVDILVLSKQDHTPATSE